MRAGGNGGSIVNISSKAAVLGGPNEWVHYAASKGAIDTMTIGLAKELAPQGVRVNIVTPGPIITPGGDEIRKTITTAMGITDQQFFSTVPLEGRAGKAEDLAEAIVFLVSPRASYITGDNLFVSGGFGSLAAL